MGSYQRHYYRLGSVIRKTVSQAQDTLYRLKLGRETQRWLDVVDRLNPVQPAGPPQTLGELCLEVESDRLRFGVLLAEYWGANVGQLMGKTPICRDIQELREVMYHKHKDPKEERLYRLIDLVRTA